MNVALIAYFLGILTALKGAGKPDHRSHGNPKADEPNNHPFPDRPITVVSIPPPPSEKEKAKQKEKERRESISFWVAIATLGALAVYTGFTIAAWWQMKNANEISRGALESVQRAFITCQDIAPIRIAQMDGKTRKQFWVFTTPCENSATTPANVVAQNFWGASSEPNEEEFLRPQPLVQQSAVGPKAGHSVGNMVIAEEDIFGRILAEDITKERPSTGEPATPLVFWGWVSYRDVFPGTKIHLTEFCKRSVFIKLTPSAPSQTAWGWTECQQHNCADEYCSDYGEVTKRFK